MVREISGFHILHAERMFKDYFSTVSYIDLYGILFPLQMKADGSTLKPITESNQ